MHVLDAVMIPLEQLNSTNPTASGTPNATPSSTAMSSASATAANSGVAAPFAKNLRSDRALWTFGASVLALVWI